MNEKARDALVVGATGIAGTGAGAVTSAALGNMGLAALGTAVAVPMLPIVAIGAGLGLVVGGAFVLGKHITRRGNGGAARTPGNVPNPSGTPIRGADAAERRRGPT